jgi:hypothetical protein
MKKGQTLPYLINIFDFLNDLPVNERFYINKNVNPLNRSIFIRLVMEYIDYKLAIGEFADIEISNDYSYIKKIEIDYEFVKLLENGEL